MNKIVITAALVLTFATSYAQFNFEIKGGLNLSTIKTNENSDTNLKPAYHIGISTSYGITKRFSITGDLLHSYKGFDKVHFSYVNIPVLVRYAATSRFSIEGGAGAGYLLSSFVLDNGKYTNVIDTWGNRLDFELCGGVRYQLNSLVSFTLRYEYGLSNVIAKKASFTYTVITYNDPLLDGKKSYNLRNDLGWADYNRNLQLSISYRLKPSKNSK